tara:strand:+ start:2212 stop:4596 length:2385 start_codon:yes stop_codon:yes gene_type:complete
MRNIAIYPGAFKPPTKGHLGVVQQVLSGKYNTAEVDKETGEYTKSSENPKIDEVWIIVGDMVKGGPGKQKGDSPEVAVDQEIAIGVWQEYLKANGLEGKVKLYRAGEIREGVLNEDVGYLAEGANPVRDLYGLLKDKYIRGEYADQDFFPIVGFRPDNAEALSDLKRMDTASKKYGEEGLQILVVVDEPTPGEESISATKLRAALHARDEKAIEKYAAAPAKELLKLFPEQDQLEKAIAEIMLKTVNDIVEGKVDFDNLEKVLDKMFMDLDIDISFTNHFKERVIERGLTEEDIEELMSKIHDKYPDELDFLKAGENRVFTHIEKLIDIAAVNKGYGTDYLKDLVLKTAYKRNSKDEPEFRTNASSPKLKVAETRADMPSPEVEDTATLPSAQREKVVYHKEYFQNLTSFPVAVDKYGNIVIQITQRLPMNEVKEVISQELNFTPLLSSILEFMLDKKMSITPIPNIEVKYDEDAATDVFGPTAHYDPTTATVCLYALGRHPKDVLRSFCHEMIHHMQNMEGRLRAFDTTNTQEDSDLKEIEKEAHALGSMTFREWEDTVKNSFDIVKEQVMAEGKYDALTTQLSSIAFTRFKDILERGEKVGEFIYNVGPEEDENNDINHPTLEFQFMGKVDITKDEYEVDGGANSEDEDEDGDPVDPFITVRFKIPQNIGNGTITWERLSFDLKDVIRHELEHITQSGPNTVGGKAMDDDQALRNMIDANMLPKASYFQLEKEIDAMIQGLYMKAKKSKQSFSEVVKEYLKTQPLDREEKESILGLWRKRLPALGIKKEYWF